MQKKLTCIICTCLLLLMLGGCGLVGAVRVQASEETINTRKELYQKVEEALKNGQTEISFETSELDTEDFDRLNQEHDGFYGTVTSYKIRSIKLLGKSYVTLNCEIYDNYYVERAILYGSEIPDDRPQAKKLLSVCKKLLPRIGGEKVSAYRKEKRIHDYLVRHVSYGFPNEEEKTEDAYSSYGALVGRKAVCNGYAQAMKLLCDLSGVTCQMISGTADGENHAWNLIKLGDNWYHVDATWDDPVPDEEERVFYHYFNVSDDFIASDHEWDEESYQEAEGGEYNYFAINDLICSDYSDFVEKCRDWFEKEDSPENLQIQVKHYDEKTYSSTALQFLFALSGADSLNMQKVGSKPDVTLYFKFTYS